MTTTALLDTSTVLPRHSWENENRPASVKHLLLPLSCSPRSTLAPAMP
jgi:hypothetical protein